MTRYEKIFESLQEKVNSGEMTFEEAEELNDIAFEKYATESDDLTLEEAMDAISCYLEDKSDISAKSDGDIEMQRIKSRAGHTDLKDVMKSKAMKDSSKRDLSIRNKLSDFGMEKQSKKSFNIANKANTVYKKQFADKKYSKATKKIYDGNLSGADDVNNLSKKALVKGGVDKKKLKTIGESVNELKLQVYEAFEEGTISEEEKSVFLDYLNR